MAGRSRDDRPTRKGPRAPAWGIAADVGTGQGRARTLDEALAALGRLDIFVNNVGGVRAGRLEAITEAQIEAMVTVDLLAPILLTRVALPALRASGDAEATSPPASLWSEHPCAPPMRR